MASRIIGTGFRRSIAECLLHSYSGAVDIHPPNPALDAVLILIAELHHRKVIDDVVLASIAERLELSDFGDVAERVEMLPFMNLIAPPIERPNGGNGED